MLLPQLLKNQQLSSPAAVPITQSGGGDISVSGESELRDIPLFAPCGVCSIPAENAQALILPLDGAAACTGILCPPDAVVGLEPGELRLFSSGGAAIVLKNNGEVLINGLTVTKEGKIIESGAKVL
ncbi:hypothetical protein [Hydrogenoanaerobacterium sp.]|uniref:hypothetical protein n=1 Tax=Hydrogenoanaerobacterium sp. TaxID=2953763 RepID=UPI0028A12224|nr:hypothetical protein [Hydrogenoanaerobacterium sp.]